MYVCVCVGGDGVCIDGGGACLKSVVDKLAIERKTQVKVLTDLIFPVEEVKLCRYWNDVFVYVCVCGGGGWYIDGGLIRSLWWTSWQ